MLRLEAESDMPAVARWVRLASRNNHLTVIGEF